VKTYSQASDDVLRIIEAIRSQYHSPDLDGVIIGARFVYDTEASEPVLKHGGYPAQAVCRITPVADRAMGMPDALITIDRSNWISLTPAQRNALIDHEITHLERAVEKETGLPKFDAVDRPKLKMRRHDHQLGWFDRVADRHGKASAEVRQATALMQESGQIYWDFEVPAAVPAKSQVGKQSEARH
jgi:hypothetical protein